MNIKDVEQWEKYKKHLEALNKPLFEAWEKMYKQDIARYEKEKKEYEKLEIEYERKKKKEELAP